MGGDYLLVFARHIPVCSGDLGGVVGVIGGLYLISEGFSLILESAKNRMTSKVDRAG